MRASAAFQRQDQTIALTLQLPLCQFEDNTASTREAALPCLSCRRSQLRTLLPLRRTSTGLRSHLRSYLLCSLLLSYLVRLILLSYTTASGCAYVRMSQDSKLLVVAGLRQYWRWQRTRSDAVSRPWRSRSLSSADPSSSFPPPRLPLLTATFS
jgi:hypothetical protein